MTAGSGGRGEDLVGMAHQPLVELVVAGHEHDDRLLRLRARPGPPAATSRRSCRGTRRARRRRARPRRCRARARSWPPRRGAARRTARARSRGARRPGSRRGRAGPDRPGRPAAGAARRRPPARCPCGCGRRRWCGGRWRISSAITAAVSRLADGRRAIRSGRVVGHGPGVGRELDAGVPEDEQPLAVGRPVVGDLGDVEPAQLGGQPTGLADGGRREDEGGLRAVVRAQPAQAAQQVGDVGAEHAAQHVQLVDHHVLAGASGTWPTGRGGAARRGGASRGW